MPDTARDGLAWPDVADDAKHILLIGGTGQIGLSLRRTGWPTDYVVHAPSRDQLDINDAGAINRTLASGRFSAVVNAAAYTAVDKSETDVSAAFAANTLAAAYLAEAARAAGVPMVHFSTDYVFDGRLDRPYRETDPASPIGVYGLSKFAGERAVLMAHPGSVVLRTAWVVSPHRSNFLKTMLRLAQTKDRVQVVADQQGCPTSAADIADATIAIVSRLVDDPSSPAGLYHLVNTGQTHWAGLAREIFAASAETGGRAAVVEEITTAEYPTPAARPANSRLATDKIAADFGIRLRPWPAAVREIVKELNQGEGI